MLDAATEAIEPAVLSRRLVPRRLPPARDQSELRVRLENPVLRRLPSSSLKMSAATLDEQLDDRLPIVEENSPVIGLRGGRWDLDGVASATFSSRLTHFFQTWSCKCGATRSGPGRKDVSLTAARCTI
mmetsp:Transcript_80732/g.159974  ORF Transcript_80732/g.159974 Transcript_80732/m.159974 type:complete len:128 (-) Transcript_80732:49-432(-)